MQGSGSQGGNAAWRQRPKFGHVWPAPEGRRQRDPDVHRTLAEIRRHCVIDQKPLDAATARALRDDPRPGARAILDAVARRQAANRAEGQRLRKLLRYETTLWQSGLVYIAGVDEAGMSPLAGPVAAAAVVLAPGTRLPGVDDSKKIDPVRRAALALEIKARAVAWSVGLAEVHEIDSLNIYWAGILAMRRAVEGLSKAPEHVLLDARRIKDLPLPQQAIVKGDSKSLSIAAASIIAKTARDAIMLDLDAAHPGYGFARHKGYPVREHREALRVLGVTPVHRRSFDAVRVALGLPPRQTSEEPATAQTALEPGARQAAAVKPAVQTRRA